MSNTTNKKNILRPSEARGEVNSSRLRSNNKLFDIGLLVVLVFIFVPLAKAQTMENSSYRLQMGNLNSFAGEVSGSSYNLSITGGQTAQGLFSGANFLVKAGFQYVRPSSTSGSFSFSISKTLIDFGTLTPTNPVTRTNTLTVNNTSAPGYSVVASENHALLVSGSGAVIPDTTCDNGNCDQTTASVWSSTLTFGFGFRCDNLSVVSNGTKTTDCIKDTTTFYNNPNHYKQFPDTSKSETASSVMSGGSGSNQQTTITYKVNISSSQPAGTYTNAVTYIATPSY